MEWFYHLLSVIAGLVLAFLPHGFEQRYIAPSIAQRTQAIVLFGGDMMFDRSVRVATQEYGEDFIFSCLGDTLQKPDLTVANLEGPITERSSRSVGSKPGDLYNTRFTFASTTALLLKRQGIDAVSIANNHSQDFQAEGVRSTMRYLEAAGVGYFGDPLAEVVYKTDVHGVKLALIGYNEFQTLVDKKWQGSTQTVAHIRAARAEGYLPVVFAHWGTEYAKANAEQKRLAREFIDAGAEIVIGAHPHVAQEHETYAGKHIYYSLGNFIFDQYFSEAVREGKLVEVTFGKNGVAAVREIPIYLERDRRTCLRG